jgi:hypothetical protein
MDEALRERLRTQVRVEVLAGYRSERSLLAHVEEVVRGEGGDRDVVAELLAYARKVLDERVQEEVRWSEPTTHDRLRRAFEALNARGILALENAGYTLSEGWEVARVAAEMSYEPPRGATFFHGQDVERAVQGGGLMLAFGSFEEDPREREAADLAIAREVREALARQGLQTEWDGRVKTRIHLPPFEWRKRQWTRLPEAPADAEEAQRARTRFSCARLLEQVVRAEGVSREEAVAALEHFILDNARKLYGEGRRLEARYDPERDGVEVFQALTVVEQLSHSPEAENERTLDEMQALGLECAAGDELVFQLFYRPEDAPEAHGQDAQFGQLLRLKTFGHGMEPLTMRSAKDGLLKSLRRTR